MTDKVAWLLLLVAIMFFSDGVCYNFLVVMTHNARSNFAVFEPLAKQLASRGHNVTVISYFPQKKSLDNYRDVSLLNENETSKDLQRKRQRHESRNDFYKKIHAIATAADFSCPKGLSNVNFQRFIQENNRFDAVLIEFFNTNCYTGLTKIYKAPLIGLSTSTLLPWVPSWFASPNSPSYIPSLASHYGDQMNFMERLDNCIFHLIAMSSWYFHMAVSGNEFSKTYLGVDLQENGMDAILYNTSLLLVNTHFSLQRPKPLVPSIIEVGGIHIREPQKLPLDIEKFINESTEGVVYMSLGSIMNETAIDKQKIESFLKAFSKIKERIIWKLDGNKIQNVPRNVVFYKWTPQLDIICHPNVKAFISHAGLLSTIEAVHCGIPTIVMPLFGDQHVNAKSLEVAGGATILNIDDVDEDIVLKALHKALNPQSRKQMKSLSEKFKDRPVSPMDNAIYWVEYVAKYRGAPHMKTAAVNMPFYKYFLLDVILFLIFALIVLCSIMYFSLNIFITFVFRRDKKLKMS